jgi:hypothetical protein
MLFGLPFLSLGIVLISLAMMAPQHRLSWLWRGACLVGALPPFVAGLAMGTATARTGDFLMAAFTVSLVGSAPLAAAMSLAVAFRLRGVV